MQLTRDRTHVPLEFQARPAVAIIADDQLPRRSRLVSDKSAAPVLAKDRRPHGWTRARADCHEHQSVGRAVSRGGRCGPKLLLTALESERRSVTPFPRRLSGCRLPGECEGAGEEYRSHRRGERFQHVIPHADASCSEDAIGQCRDLPLERPLPATPASRGVPERARSRCVRSQLSPAGRRGRSLGALPDNLVRLSVAERYWTELTTCAGDDLTLPRSFVPQRRRLVESLALLFGPGNRGRS
jgi:hypothetical protein